jgi:hypothetical protein
MSEVSVTETRFFYKWTDNGKNKEKEIVGLISPEATVQTLHQNIIEQSNLGFSTNFDLYFAGQKLNPNQKLTDFLPKNIQTFYFSLDFQADNMQGIIENFTKSGDQALTEYPAKDTTTNTV